MVGQGFVQSLACPGGKFITRLQSLNLPASVCKLSEGTRPGRWRSGFLRDLNYPELWPVAQALGQTRGWKLLSVQIRDFREIAAAFNTAADAGAGALLVPASGLLFSRTSQIAELAAVRRLPTITS
jgi:putative ABC transport system substrate-binding protein